MSRQTPQGQSRGPQAQAGIPGADRDPSSGPHSRRRSVTCSKLALGMGMPPCSSAGTRGVSRAGPWVGVPAGRSGTTGSLPSSATSAPSVRAAPLGAPQHSRGAQLQGPGTAGPPGRSEGTGRAARDPRVGSWQPPPPASRPPPRAAPLCRRDKAQPVPGPDKGGLCWDCPREEPRGQGSRGTCPWSWHTGHGTRRWYSPWLWHTVGAQPCLGAERAPRVEEGPVCPGQHRETQHPVPPELGASALAPRATTKPYHH